MSHLAPGSAMCVARGICTGLLLGVSSCELPPSLLSRIPTLPLVCEGQYRSHLQGLATDRTSVYWGFTHDVVKSDLRGHVLKRIAVEPHHGDLCWVAGLVYVAVNFGAFNEAAGAADSWVYVYSGHDLSFVRRHRVADVVHGAGGITYRDGRFFVVGGLPKGHTCNLVYEYDCEFRFVRRHSIPGYTLMGIQTAAFHHGVFWFGCYGEPKTVLCCSTGLDAVTSIVADGSLGVLASTESDAGEFLVGRWDAKPGRASIDLADSGLSAALRARLGRGSHRR